MHVSHRTLYILAALTWYWGVSILLVKGHGLAGNAEDIKPEGGALFISWIGGVVLGLVKARYIFFRSARKNLDRISVLIKPRVWQFFKPRFFSQLVLMVMLGATLSRSAQGNYPFLISVAILDISIGTALLASSWEFWTRKVIVQANR